MSDLLAFLEKHLHAVFTHDVDTYHATTSPDLTLYEWYLTPHRIDGLPFHDFMLTEAARGGALAMTGAAPTHEVARVQFALANYREQLYGDTAIVSYTLLIQQSTSAGVTVLSYNESRVLIQFPAGWQVVHVHKSPAWNAPFQPPTR